MKQKVFIWIAIAIVFLLCFSCRTKYVPVELKTTETVEYHDTTIVKELVPYKDSVEVRDTSSFLSNSYAYSWAVWNNGTLHHSLGIWPGKVLIMKIPHYMTVTRRVEVPKIVEVEKKLSWWQQIKIDWGSLSMLLNVIVIGLIIVKWIKKRGGR